MIDNEWLRVCRNSNRNAENWGYHFVVDDDADLSKVECMASG
jgi:hypothetical protein